MVQLCIRLLTLRVNLVDFIRIFMQLALKMRSPENILQMANFKMCQKTAEVDILLRILALAWL